MLYGTVTLLCDHAVVSNMQISLMESAVPRIAARHARCRLQNNLLCLHHTFRLATSNNPQIIPLSTLKAAWRDQCNKPALLGSFAGLAFLQAAHRLVRQLQA
jgi:hypothetical protein